MAATISSSQLIAGPRVSYSMTNGNWVCFECRTSQRRSCWRLATYFLPWIVGSIGNGKIICPECKRSCRFLGHKIAVPAKRDDNGWKQLRKYVNERHCQYRTLEAESNTRKKHEIERRIQEIQDRPKNKDREQLVKKLHEELEQLN